MRQAGSSRLGVCHLTRALMVSVTPHGSRHKFTLVRDYLSCTIEYAHFASGPFLPDTWREHVRACPETSEVEGAQPCILPC